LITDVIKCCSETTGRAKEKYFHKMISDEILVGNRVADLP